MPAKKAQEMPTMTAEQRSSERATLLKLHHEHSHSAIFLV